MSKFCLNELKSELSKYFEKYTGKDTGSKAWNRGAVLSMHQRCKVTLLYGCKVSGCKLGTASYTGAIIVAILIAWSLMIVQAWSTMREAWDDLSRIAVT